MKKLLALIALLMIVSPAAFAQQRGSRYVSTDSWIYDVIVQLRTRGYLPGLDPLAQPYTRDEVAHALLLNDTTTMSRSLLHYDGLLRSELRHELNRIAGSDSASVGAAVYAGAHASTSRRLDPLLPLRRGTKRNAWPYYALEGWGERSIFAVDVRLYHDLWYESTSVSDPDGTDPGGIVVLNRTDNAYLSVAHPLGTFMIGRMHRNWSPLGTRGLMVSDVATSYPQIAIDLGGRHLVIRYFFGELDSIFGYYRHIAANQVEYRSNDFAISLGEAKVYANNNPGIRLRELNPVELIFFDQDNQPYAGLNNGIINGSMWWRVGGTTIRGEAILDDIDVSPPPGRKREPTLFAISGGIHNTSLLQNVELGLDYEVVSAYAYRTPYQNRDQWSFFQRGLGANFSDYDRLTASATLLTPLSGLRLSPALQIQRKGEGDLRQAVPDSANYYGSRALFLGVRENTLRAALRGRYQPTRHAYAEWDGGFNFVKNADHIRDRKLTEFQGVVRVGVEWATN